MKNIKERGPKIGEHQFKTTEFQDKHLFKTNQLRQIFKDKFT